MKLLKFFTLFTLMGSSCVTGDTYLRRSEDSEVAICSEFEICSLVHNPTWGINSVEKLCKCPDDTYCPATFSPDDGFSLPVNFRTQMKFCSSIDVLESKLKACDSSEIAIQVKTVYHVDQVKNVSANLMCNCNFGGPNYWAFESRIGKAVLDDEKLFEVFDNFRCSEITKCNTDEFCGLARLDFGFIFQRCSCDNVHDCRYFPEESEVEENVDSELFYNGLMYKSRCIKNETFEHW